MARKMKDSGIEWIGQIPEDWEKYKLKYGFNFQKGINSNKYTKEYIGVNKGRYPVYSGQTENDGVMGFIDTYDYSIEECLFTTTVGAKVMDIRLLKGKFNLSQNCLIMISNGLFDINYIYYFLQSLFDFERFMIPQYMQPSLRISDLENYALVAPNINEQIKIFYFLDKKIKKINHIKNTVTKEIENLENYKKSLITEAVTKGLDKNVEMKDSGIEWIGEIPKHWRTVPLKQIASYNQETLDESTRKDYEFEYIDIGSVEYGRGILPLELMTFDKAPSRARRVVRAGDIIISTVRTYLKAIAIIPQSDTKMVASTGFCVIRSDGSIEQEFLKYSVQSEHFVSEIASRSTGVSYPAINSTDLVNIKVLVPTRDERIEIVDYLDKKTKLIDDSIAIKQKQLETLEEYKKSLIYEYVTGKKEV